MYENRIYPALIISYIYTYDDIITNLYLPAKPSNDKVMFIEGVLDKLPKYLYFLFNTFFYKDVC
jgi:hypothetical protein